MGGFFRRHFIATTVVAAVIAWALVYLPTTPSYAIFSLKRAVDARDPVAAARYVNFVSVVKHAGYEMLREKGAGRGSGADASLAALIGRGAIDAMAQPMADVARAWAERQVAEGARDVQIPAAAVAGTVLLLHRNGGSAYTRFTDRKGRRWEIHMARNAAGVWQVTQVDNIAQLLKGLRPSGSGTAGAAK